MVDTGTGDDAGIYKLDDQLALVQTIDFFTPIVDDPYLYGQIAATNSLSDIYAMGATPVSALNIACFPDDVLSAEVLASILQGGADKVAESNAVVIGGHSIKDKELKYGLAVTGVIHPQDIKKNNNVKPGDKLLLTKPLGTGILTTALKNAHFTEEDISDAIESMLLLNRDPAKLLIKYKANAVTDVTGFGLLGHLIEMCEASKVSAEIEYSKVPVIPGIEWYIEKKTLPGGTHRNFNSYGFKVNTISDTQKAILCDPQTSGGLLIAVDPQQKSDFLKIIGNRGIDSEPIGRIIDKTGKVVHIV